MNWHIFCIQFQILKQSFFQWIIWVQNQEDLRRVEGSLIVLRQLSPLQWLAHGKAFFNLSSPRPHPSKLWHACHSDSDLAPLWVMTPILPDAHFSSLSPLYHALLKFVDLCSCFPAISDKTAKELKSPQQQHTFHPSQAVSDQSAFNTYTSYQCD